MLRIQQAVSKTCLQRPSWRLQGEKSVILAPLSLCYKNNNGPAHFPAASTLSYLALRSFSTSSTTPVKSSTKRRSLSTQEKPSASTKTESSLPSHTLNCGKALVKAHESKSFREIVSGTAIDVLQGIGPVHAGHLQAVKLTTVKDLANYKYFHIARALTTLAAAEEAEGRLAGSLMNVDKAVDKAWETKSLQEIVKQPVSALQGLTPEAAATWKSLGVASIKDLATYKYCQWAEAMVEAAKYEV